MAERFTQRVQLGQQNLSSGAASTFMQLGDTMQGISQQVAQKVGRDIAQDSFQAGQEALVEGEKPQFKTERFIGGVEAANFNKGLRNAYVASVSNDAREALNKIELDSPSDVIAYNQQAEAYKSGVMKELDGPAASIVQQQLDKSISMGRTRVQERGFKQQAAKAAEESRAAMNGFGNDAARFARNGDTEAAAANLQSAQAVVAGAVDAGQITAQQGKDQIAAMTQQVNEEEIRHTLDNVADEHGVDEAINQIDAAVGEPPKGWTPDDWRSFVASERTELMRRKSQQNAQRVEVDKRAVNALKDYEKAQALGFEVDAQETATVEALVADKPELKERFDLSQDVATFSVLSGNDRADILEASKTGKLADVNQYAAMSSANQKLNAMAREDGYGLGVKQGLVELIPMDISNPESFKLKQDQADMLSDHYGVEVSPLTDGEAQALSNGLADMTSNEKVALAVALQDSPAVWGQVAGKQGGTFAMAGATGDVNLMGAVFGGQELINAKLAAPIKPADFREDFNDAVEGVYGADDARDIQQAAIAHYAATFDKSGIYNSSDFEASIEAVTGGLGSVNGFKVELPRGVSEDDLADFVEDMQPETIAAFGGVAGVSNERAAELIQSGRLRNIKSGEYIVDTDMGALFGPNGKPFVIKWSEDAAIRNSAVSESTRAAESEARRVITEEDMSRSSQPISAQGVDNSRRKSPTRGLN